jgi:thymidine kinase
MKKISEKQKVLNEQYHELAEVWLAEHSICERCGAHATQIHHKKGRRFSEDGIPLLLHTKYFMAVCYPCHYYIENNRSEGYEKGWLEHRHHKVA